MTVILSKYDSAILKADMEFIDDEYVSILLKYSFKRYLGKTVAIINPKYPYNTQEEEKIARYEHENKRRDFIIRYLKDNYPSFNYHKRYAKENKWNKPLRFHNQKTKSCKYLNEDGRHCNKIRKNSTCYTCCFSCELVECNKGECKLV